MIREEEGEEDEEEDGVDTRAVTEVRGSQRNGEVGEVEEEEQE